MDCLFVFLLLSQFIMVLRTTEVWQDEPDGEIFRKAGENMPENRQTLDKCRGKHGASETGRSEARVLFRRSKAQVNKVQPRLRERFLLQFS